jgi:hypothetical protein
LGHGNIVVRECDPYILVEPELPPWNSLWHLCIIKNRDQERREDEVIVPDKDPHSYTGKERLVKQGLRMIRYETTFPL